jgi:hypothetical protein
MSKRKASFQKSIRLQGILSEGSVPSGIPPVFGRNLFLRVFQQGCCPSQVAQQARKSFLLSRAGKYWVGATLARATSRLLAQKGILIGCVTRSRPTEVSPHQPITFNETGHLAEDFTSREPLRTLSGGVLRDLACVQVPLLAGVVSLLIGDALQDRFATFTRELVDKGKRVLAAAQAPAIEASRLNPFSSDRFLAIDAARPSMHSQSLVRSIKP